MFFFLAIIHFASVKGIIMEEKAPKLRSEEIRVKFSPDMKKRVDRIAALHGTPSATWCHHVIAQAVVAFERHMQIQNRTTEQFVQSMAAFMEPQIRSLLEDNVLPLARAKDVGEGPTGPESDGAEGRLKG